MQISWSLMMILMVFMQITKGVHLPEGEVAGDDLVYKSNGQVLSVYQMITLKIYD